MSKKIKKNVLEILKDPDSRLRAPNSNLLAARICFNSTTKEAEDFGDSISSFTKSLAKEVSNGNS